MASHDLGDVRGGGGAPVDRWAPPGAENRVSALEKLHASQLERERKEHAAIEAELRRKSRLCARSWTRQADAEEA